MDNMKLIKLLWPLILRALIYSSIIVGVIFVIRHDFADAIVDEYSAIEIFQETLLGISVTVLLFNSINKSHYKLFFNVLAAVLGVHFIREFDFWLNNNLFDKAWQAFAGVVIIITLYFIIKNFKKLIIELERISKTYSFGIFFLGFIILHTFSRLFGSKKIWNVLLEPTYQGYISSENGKKIIDFEEYVYPIKAGAQEGVELLAYAIIFIGVIEMIIFGIKSSRNKEI